MNSIANDLTLFQALQDNVAEDINSLKKHYKNARELSTEERTHALASIVFSLCTNIRSTLVEWANSQENFSNEVFKRIAKDPTDLYQLYKFLRLFRSAVFNPTLVDQFQKQPLQKAAATIEAYVQQQKLISLRFTQDIIQAKAEPEFPNLRLLIAAHSGKIISKL